MFFLKISRYPLHLMFKRCSPELACNDDVGDFGEDVAQSLHSNGQLLIIGGTHDLIRLFSNDNIVKVHFLKQDFASGIITILQITNY